MSGGSTNQRHDRHAWRETRNYERGRLGDGESGLVEGELIEERGVDGEASEWGSGGEGATSCSGQQPYTILV